MSHRLAEWWEVLIALRAPPEDFVWLTRVLTEGLQVTPSSVTVERAALENYPSARLLQPQLEEYLQEDISLGHLAKVHVSQIHAPLRIHPIALIPKPGQPGKYRLITDISAPEKRSVNDLAPPPPPFRMVSVRNLFNRVRRNMWAGKIDVAHAFRNIPLARLFAGHLAFRVGDHYYFELRLPFGFTWSPFVWNSFSDFVQRFCALKGVNCVVYCDDFLIMAGNKRDCFRDMCFLLEVLRLLGIPVKPSKIIWPTQRLDFLGLELDFVKLTISASSARVSAILAEISEILKRKFVPFPKLESLVGKLSFVAQIIAGGRTFLRRIFDAFPTSRSGKIPISPGIRADLSWWLRFLPIWNGTARMVPDFSRPRVAFTSDASDLACAGVLKDRALVHAWSPKQLAWHINIKELWSVYHCLRLWSHQFRGAFAIVGCDNSAVVSWINNGTARSPLAMKILRKIFWIRAKFNIQLHATWISTDVNSAADAASRLDFPRFFSTSGISYSGISFSGMPSAPFPPLPILANSPEHPNLLKWLRTSSLPMQERSYWPLMHDPRNVLEWPHGKFLFGFALPMGTNPGCLPRSCSFGSPRSSTWKDMPSPPSRPTSPPCLRSIPPWVYRLVSRDWNAPRFTYFGKDYVASLLRLEDQKKESLFPCSGNSEIPWTRPTASSWLSGQPSQLVSFPSSARATSFHDLRKTLREFYSSDARISNSEMITRFLKSGGLKQTSSEIGKSVFQYPRFPEIQSAPCLPSKPSSALTRLSRRSPPFPSALSDGCAIPIC